MLTTFGSPSSRRVLLRRFGEQHQPGCAEGRRFVGEHQEITWPVEFEAARIPGDLRLDAVSQRPDVAGEHIHLADEISDRDPDLSGHGETGIIHQLELIVGQKPIVKHRLTVHGHLKSRARLRARVGRVRRDLGESRPSATALEAIRLSVPAICISSRSPPLNQNRHRKDLLK